MLSLRARVVRRVGGNGRSREIALSLQARKMENRVDFAEDAVGF